MARCSFFSVVRVRPPLTSTDPGFDLIPQRFQRSMVQVTSATSLAVDSPQGRKLFVFDRVFGEDVEQQGIWNYLDESVNAFVQGYNVSVLAYGQSGAGKSYTMGTSGPAEQSDPNLRGTWFYMFWPNLKFFIERSALWTGLCIGANTENLRGHPARCHRVVWEAVRTSDIESQRLFWSSFADSLLYKLGADSSESV